MFSPLPLLMRTVRCGKYVGPDWRKKCKQKSKSLETRVTQRRQTRYGELDNISRQFDCGDDEYDDGVWGSTGRERRRVLFFSPNISQWVWEEEKGVNTTHTHTQDGWSHRTTQWLHRHCPDKHSRFPPLLLFILFTLLALRALVTMKTHFFGLVKVTWFVFWRNLKENKVCASVMT